MRLICVVVLRYTLIVGLGHSELEILGRTKTSNNNQMNGTSDQTHNQINVTNSVGYNILENTMRIALP